MPRRRSTKSTNPAEWFAERQIEVIRVGKRPRKVTLSIGPASQQPRGEWACEVSAAGLYKRLSPQRGVDAFQSIILAISLLRQLVGAEIERGATVRWSGEPTSLAEIFG